MIDVVMEFPKSAEEGEAKEKHFAKDIETHEYAVEWATKEENKFSHIDMWITKHGKRFSVDVKKIKSIEYSGDEDDRFIWIELKCVGGGRGWIESKADFIVFELDSQWMMVRTKRLKEYVLPRVLDEYIDRPSKKQLYKKYLRRMHWLKNKRNTIIAPEKSDLIVLFTTEEIRPFLSWAFEKSKPS